MLSMITTYIIPTVFVLGVLIFFHELGHFLMAKKIGIKVEKFSLGFGPKILGFKRGDTEYMLSAFPIGGYVKMAGETTDDDVTGADYEFASRTPWERLQVVVCGPLTNIVLAYLVMVMVFFMGRKVPQYYGEAPVISWIETGSIANKAGLQVGDKILEIDNKAFDNWADVYLFVKMAAVPSHTLNFIVERDNAKLNFDLTIDKKSLEATGSLGFAHYMAPEIGGFSKGFPAESSGLKVGDIITKIDGAAVNHWIELSQIIHKKPEHRVELTVRRGDSVFNLPITPKLDEESGVGLIGIRPVEIKITKRYGLIDSISHGVDEVNRLFSLTLEFLGRVVSGRASSKSIGGPIAIAQIAGSAAASGMADLLWVMGFISLQLGMLNLMPIPILDGGLTLFLIIEVILRRPISLKKREIAQQVGLALIILLMIFAFYNDIMRLIVG